MPLFAAGSPTPNPNGHLKSVLSREYASVKNHKTWRKKISENYRLPIKPIQSRQFQDVIYLFQPLISAAATFNKQIKG